MGKVVRVVCGNCRWHPLGHTVGFALGVCITLLGTTMAINGHVLFDSFPMLLLWDATAYTIHGLGVIPIIGHGERLYQIIVGE